MAKYRKRPLVIEAEQLTERTVIHTLEGDMVGEVGDWLIKGIEGEVYPCKDSVFQKTYEPVPLPKIPKSERRRRAIKAMNERERPDYCWEKDHPRNIETDVVAETYTVPSKDEYPYGGGIYRILLCSVCSKKYSEEMLIPYA